MTTVEAIEETAATSGACRACGCARVEADLVSDAAGGEALALAECTRCGHRWTRPASLPPRAPARVRARRVRDAVRSVPTAA